MRLLSPHQGHSVAVSPAPVAARHRAGGLDKASSIPHAVLCPWTGCHAPTSYPMLSGLLVSPYSSGYPAVSPQHQVPWCHHAPCSARYPISPTYPAGTTYPSWSLPRCPIAQSGVFGRVGPWRTLQVVGGADWESTLREAVWKTLIGWVRGTGVPSSKGSMGESQLVGSGRLKDIPK